MRRRVHDGWAPLALALLLASCHGDAQRGAGGPDAASDASSPADAGPATVQILDEGAEPRIVHTYALKRPRRELRVLALDSLLEGESTVGDQLELRFAVDYPAGGGVELRVRDARSTASDVPKVASTVGTRVVQKLGGGGTLDPPEVVPPPGADGAAEAYVKGAILQVAATFMVPFPPSPIGVGARWRWGEDGPVYRLVSQADGKIVVERTHEVHGKRRLERGKSYDVEEEQWARIETTLTAIASQVESKLVVRKGKGPKRTTHLRFDVFSGPPGDDAP